MRVHCTSVNCGWTVVWPVLLLFSSLISCHSLVESCLTESFDNNIFLESEIPNTDDLNAATKEPAEAPEVEKEPELSPEEQKGKWGLC